MPVSYKKSLILILVSLTVLSCKNQSTNNSEIQHYLHISHTRTNKNPEIDSVAAQINFKKFDMLWCNSELPEIMFIHV